MAYAGTMRFSTQMDTSGFTKGIGQIASGISVYRLVSSAVRMVGNAVKDAVERFDILQRFPKILESMGYSAEDAAAATSKLADGIEGLPTTLPGIIELTQQLMATNMSANDAADAAVALNRGLLASGATAEKASQGTEAFVKQLSAGKVDLKNWTSMMRVAPSMMSDLAEAFGYGRDGARDLYQALKDGKVTLPELTNKMVELSNATNGWADKAKIATEGIGTSFDNIKNALVKGLANTLKTVSDAFQNTFGMTLPQALDNFKYVINSTFDTINAHLANFIANLDVDFLINTFDRVKEAAAGFARSIDFESVKSGISDLIAAFKSLITNLPFETLQSDFQTFASFINSVLNGAITLLTNTIKFLADNIQTVLPIVKAFFVAWAGYTIFNTAVGAIKALVSAMAAHNAALMTGKMTLIASKVLQEELVLAQLRYNVTKTAAAAAELAAAKAAVVANSAEVARLRTSQLTLGTLANQVRAQAGLAAASIRSTVTTIAQTAATQGLGAAMLALPLTWIIVGLAALAAGAYLLISHFTSLSEEGNRVANTTAKIAERTRELNEASAALREQLENNLRTINQQEEASLGIVGQMDNIKKAYQEGELSAETYNEEMTKLTDQLNTLMGLNLTWDAGKQAWVDSTGAVIDNTDAIRANIQAKLESARADAYLSAMGDSAVEASKKADNLTAALNNLNDASQLVADEGAGFLNKNLKEQQKMAAEAKVAINSLAEEYQQTAKWQRMAAGLIVEGWTLVDEKTGEVTKNFTEQQQVLMILQEQYGVTAENIKLFAEQNNMTIGEVTRGLQDFSIKSTDVLASQIPKDTEAAKLAFRAWIDSLENWDGTFEDAMAKLKKTVGEMPGVFDNMSTETIQAMLRQQLGIEYSLEEINAALGRTAEVAQEAGMTLGAAFENAPAQYQSDLEALKTALINAGIPEASVDQRDLTKIPWEDLDLEPEVKARLKEVVDAITGSGAPEAAEQESSDTGENFDPGDVPAENVRASMEAAKAAIEVGGAALKSTMGTATTDVANAADSLKTDLPPKFKDAGDAANTELSSAGPIWQSTTLSSVNLMKQPLETLNAAGYAAGKGLGDGVAAGAKASLEAAKSAVAIGIAAIKAEIAGAKGFDVNSPSRWSIWVMQMVGKGFTQQFKKLTPEVVSMAENFSDKMKSVMDIGGALNITSDDNLSKLKTLLELDNINLSKSLENTLLTPQATGDVSNVVNNTYYIEGQSTEVDSQVEKAFNILSEMAKRKRRMGVAY